VTADDTPSERLRREAESIMQGADVGGPLEEGLVQLHEVFLSLKKGGFTKSEALWICGYIMSGGAKGAIGETDDTGD
jgi:hypothetical protein